MAESEREEIGLDFGSRGTMECVCCSPLVLPAALLWLWLFLSLSLFLLLALFAEASAVAAAAAVLLAPPVALGRSVGLSFAHALHSLLLSSLLSPLASSVSRLSCSLCSAAKPGLVQAVAATTQLCTTLREANCWLLLSPLPLLCQVCGARQSCRRRREHDSGR